MTTNGSSISQWTGTRSGQQPYYLVIIDFDGGISFTNGNFFRCLPTDRPSALAPAGQNLLHLIHDQDRQLLNKTLAACSLRDEAITTELRVKNDRYHWVKWEISRIRKPEIMSDKFLCLGYEIASADQQQKSIEVFNQQYRPDNTLFHSFMEHLPGFCWVVDEDDNLMFGNALFLEYMGLDGAVFGQSIDDIFPAAIAGPIRDEHRLVSESGSPHHSTIRLLANNGREEVCQLIVFPIRTPGPCQMTGGHAYHP